MNQHLIQRKESIILSAIEAIDENGIQAISTRDIAKREGISESIIFKYFPKKNDLILAVLDYFSLYDQALIETADSKKMKPREAIIYFLDSYSTYYENYPALTAVTQAYGAFKGKPELGDKAKKIFDERTGFLEKQIESAKELGLINPDTDSESLACIIISTFSGLCLKWRMQDYTFPLRKKIASTMMMILNNFGLN